MASGFIYLIILGMWAAYFLPKWITTHDETSGKSAERYKSAMRVVGETGSVSPVSSVTENIKKANQIVTRRIIFSVISSLTLISSSLVGLGIFSSAILFLPLSALAIYVVHVRRQVIQAEFKKRRLKAFTQISTATVITEPRERVTFSAREDFKAANNEHWIPLIERIDSAGVVVIPKDGAAWQPTSIPKPTYITASKAIPANRVIDLTVPGTWSDIHATRDELFDQELESNAAEARRDVVNE